MNDEQTPALRQAVENMTTMREAYDNLSQAAEAYNTGKVQLAANITSKGVSASASETLPELAGKVAQIAQQPIVMNDGDLAHMYSNQLFGGATNTTSVLWNLYDILAQMKNQFINASYSSGGNTYSYEALMVCEYYKGYDSLQLKGADAYFTCDGDFYPYANALHYWHDTDNGKANRWVCFLYAQAGAATFTVGANDTAISPRSIYVGGHIGTIEYQANGRLTELVSGVEETDVVDNLLFNGYTQEFGRILTINNIRNVSGLVNDSTDTLVLSGLTGTISKSGGRMFYGKSFVYVNANNAILSIGGNTAVCSDGIGIEIKGVKTITSSTTITGSYKSIVLAAPSQSELQFLHIEDTTSVEKNVAILAVYAGGTFPDLIDISVGAFEMNLYIAVWNPTNVLADADKKAKLIDNIKNHILARVSDATGGTQLVFTVSTNMYNNIASEQIEWQGETMSLADAFLTKNWLLAGV